MLTLILITFWILRILSIPLIIIIGESNINERTKTIVLLVLSFIYNNFIGFVAWTLGILMYTSISILTIIIIGAWIIAINIYIKEKTDINTTIYIIFVVVAFLIGVLLK